MTPAKILAIKLRSLGDTVLLTAPLFELAQAFPQSQIHALVPEEWGDLLAGIPNLKKIWTLPSRQKSTQRFAFLLRMGFQLRKARFDMVINFHASQRSAALARASGARARSIHFHGHSTPNRFSTVTIPGKGAVKPIIERDMDAIRAFGIHVPAGRPPQLFLSTTEIREAENTLQGLHLRRPLLGLGIGATRSTKCWPIDRFAWLAVEWCQKEGGGVLAFAGPHETEVTRKFLIQVNDLLCTSTDDVQKRGQMRAQISAIHHLNPRELSGIISRLSVFVGNDSGPRHIATAVNTPTVTLFGPEHPFEWHPYPTDKHPYFFIEGLPCRSESQAGNPSWCSLSECMVEEHKCMKQISVSSVLSTAQKLARRNLL